MITSESNINNEPERLQWFVMRDLKRSTAKHRANDDLVEQGFETFTPMTSKVSVSRGRSSRVEVPVVADLLFVQATRSQLDPVVASLPTLQYRFVRGAVAGTPMTVRDGDMQRFMAAVGQTPTAQYYTPEEITPEMLGRSVRILGEGPLQGYECRLLKVRGSRKRRVLVELPGVLSVAVEVSPDFIELL